jgi:hypothetical protein
MKVAFSQADMLPCASVQLFGVECPGCGLQRSVALLMEGALIESFLMYPGLIPMLILFAFIGLDRWIGFKNGQRIIAALGILTVGLILINFTLKIIT